MGYTLKIGEYASEFHDEYGQTYISQYVVDAEFPDAPAYGEPTDNTNSRWPSYSGWSDFACFVGLHDLFFNKEFGLIRQHPGCIPLAVRHQAAINAAYDKMLIEYPGITPGFSDAYNEHSPEPHLARLTWLKYWVDWAMKTSNCEHPVFYNS